MPKENNKKENNNNDNVTLKEASGNLGISESTIKKYLKDFDLPACKGFGSKATMLQETYKILTEIAKLRTNGLSIQEIKELRSQQPMTNIQDVVDEVSQKLQEETTQEVLPDEVKESLSVEMEPDKPQHEEKEEAIQEQQEEEPQRRRGFNYRYVERQISNDSKRVTYLRRRLHNPNIPIQEKLFFEEALERRILFLNGWKHILRWVSKQ